MFKFFISTDYINTFKFNNIFLNNFDRKSSTKIGKLSFSKLIINFFSKPILLTFITSNIKLSFSSSTRLYKSFFNLSGINSISIHGFDVNINYTVIGIDVPVQQLEFVLQSTSQ